MMRTRHGVNDSGGRDPLGRNEFNRISMDGKHFIPLAGCSTIASFYALDSHGLASI
jgi:hypothetical protein